MGCFSAWRKWCHYACSHVLEECGPGCDLTTSADLTSVNLNVHTMSEIQEQLHSLTACTTLMTFREQQTPPRESELSLFNFFFFCLWQNPREGNRVIHFFFDPQQFETCLVATWWKSTIWSWLSLPLNMQNKHFISNKATRVHLAKPSKTYQNEQYLSSISTAINFLHGAASLLKRLSGISFTISMWDAFPVISFYFTASALYTRVCCVQRQKSFLGRGVGTQPAAKLLTRYQISL